jgi:hypothetical protein
MSAAVVSDAAQGAVVVALTTLQKEGAQVLRVPLGVPSDVQEKLSA